MSASRPTRSFRGRLLMPLGMGVLAALGCDDPVVRAAQRRAVGWCRSRAQQPWGRASASPSSSAAPGRATRHRAALVAISCAVGGCVTIVSPQLASPTPVSARPANAPVIPVIVEQQAWPPSGRSMSSSPFGPRKYRRGLAKETPMIVEQIMTQPAVTCSVCESLDAAARLMWEHDCGAIAVLGEGGKLAGMLTDRDICMATFTKGAAPQAIGVAEIMSRRITTCAPSDSVSTAEGLMRNHQIRRIPVVDGDRRVLGMLSLSDVARYAATTRRHSSVDRELVQTLAAIGEHRSSQRAGMFRV
jgi:CBS domain-containing protein